MPSLGSERSKLTPEQRSRVMALVVTPGGGPPIPPDEFLRAFGAPDGGVLGLDLLRNAADRRDPIDVELALVVGFRFGFSGEHVELLIALAFADWHRSHQDVALALGHIHSQASVDALEHPAEWVPDYLAFDDARALATQAIWALGGISGDAADRALVALSRSASVVVAQAAIAQLGGRL